MSFYTRWYRFRRWRRDYVRAQDGLNLIAALLMGALATLSYSTHPNATLLLGTVYGVVVLVIFTVTVRTRRARDQVQAEVLWGLFSLINKEVFKADHRTRFTLFRPDSLRSEYITPWYRYLKGGRGPIEEALVSRARYKRGEGMTGRAWAECGRSLLLQVFPKFSTREEFEDHYINQLKIAKATVKELSDHMIQVQTMFCYAFVADADRTLGVLSLDFEAPLTLHPQPSFPSPDDDHPIPLDHGHLRLLLGSVVHVLESFSKMERRFK